MNVDYLAPRNKEELEFIRQNPGKSIEAVVRYMAKIDLASRITVRNDLAELEEEGYIVVRKEKPRSQIYRLFINEENLLIKAMSEMNEFKEKYFALLKNMKRKYPQIDSRTLDILRSRREPGILNRYDFMRLAWPLFDHFIGIYLMRAIFTWQKDIKDAETVNKLYALLFETVREINLKLSELCFDKTASHQKSSVFDYLLEQSFELTPPKLEYLLSICNSHDLNKEIESLVDSLWNISSGLANKVLEGYKYDKDFYELSKIPHPEDWKEAVRVVRKIKNEKKLRYGKNLI